MRLAPGLPSFDPPFVGRRALFDELRGRLDDGTRLITLVGTGGVGKTRLAGELAIETSAAADRRVWFCDLSPTRSLDEMIDTVVRTLRPPAEALRGGDISEGIGAWLARQGPALVVLDNFEHVVSFAQQTVGLWCTQTERAVFLVTSRQPLEVAGETIVPVEPLSVPPATEHSPERIAASEAVQLFLGRARRGGSTAIDVFRDADLLAAMVRRLDGLPLAIELAAARLELLSLRQIHDRFERRFELLRTPRANISDRQKTLWGAIAWSWQLLADVERSALVQATVFAGGFSVEAAEAVIQLPSGGSVLDAIQGLCHKSLLRVDRARGDSPRLDMFESVREYVEGMPEAADARFAALARHEAYFVRHGEAWASAVDRRGGLVALEHLAAEHENLAAVFHRASTRASTDQDAAAVVLRAILALGALYSARGPARAHIRMLDVAIGAAHAVDGGTMLRASAILARGRALRFEGRIDEALTDLDRALALAREASDRALEGVALGEIGAARTYKGQRDAAFSHYEQALELHRAVGDRRHEGIALARIGLLHTQYSELDAAEPVLTAARTILHEVGDRQFEGFALHYLGGVFLERGRLPACVEHEDQALSIFREVGSRLFEGSALGHLAIADHLEGNAARARARYAGVLSICIELDQRWLRGVYEAALGVLDTEEGALSDADQHLETALALMRGAGDERYQGVILSLQAAVDALRGDTARAAALLEEGSNKLAAVADRVVAHVVDVVRGILDAVTAERAELRGDRLEAAALLASARRRLAESVDVPSVDTRFLRRLLAQAIERIGRQADAWVVDPRAAWFASPGGERVDFAPASPTWRVFLALVEHRLGTDEEPLTFDRMVAAGWPGIRIARSTAQNRLHVALNALRKKGLKPILCRGPSGYALDRSVALRIVAEGRLEGSEELLIPPAPT